jgi:hypothetical protein
MTAIDFPNSPEVNDTHVVNGVTYTWDGTRWKASFEAGGGGIVFTRHTANVTAEAGQGIIADTSGGTFTVTLPATPSEGDTVVIADGADFGTVNLTVARNGSTIEGQAENLTLDIGGVKTTLVFDGVTWQVYAQAGIVVVPEYVAAAGQWVEVSRTVVSTAVATVDFTGIDSSADEWAVHIYKAEPSNTTGVTMYCRFSSNGSDWHTATYTYGSMFTANNSATIDSSRSVSATEIQLENFSCSPAPGGLCDIEILLNSPARTDTVPRIKWSLTGVYNNATPTDNLTDDKWYYYTGFGGRMVQEAVQGLRFYFDTGNIASGTFVLLKRIKP